MQIKNEQYNWVIEFLREAGEIALQYQDKVTESLKANKSIVTEADIKISNLFSEYMVKNTDENHCLIDEEKCATVEEFKKKNSNKEYIWILDPIDGTKPYYHGLSTWGIMVSLFKNGEPIMSACYAPAMRDLIFANNVDRMYVKNPFTKDEEVKEMQATSRDLDNQSIVIAPE